MDRKSQKHKQVKEPDKPKRKEKNAMSTPTFTMFHANCVGNAVNCLYSHKVELWSTSMCFRLKRWTPPPAAYPDYL